MRITIQAGVEDDNTNDRMILCCAISPSSSVVCVAFECSGTLKLFDVASGEHRLTLEGWGVYYCCAFSPDGTTIMRR